MALDDILAVANPWLAAPDQQVELISSRLPRQFIPRDQYLTPNAERVSLVVGPRQAGKSTLLLDTARHQPRPLLVINLEEPALRTLCRSAAEFVQWLHSTLGAPTFVVFEEAQHLAEAGLFLKGLVDLKTQHVICATGSSSYHLRARTRESLAGRAERIKLLPLSLNEVLGDAPNPLTRRRHGRERWKRQLRHGGYPAVWQSTNPESDLHRLAEAFVVRDASDLFAVQDLSAFRTLLGLVAADAGSLVNISNWASEVGVSRDTIGRWIDLLAETHLVQRLRPFLGGKRAELKSATKAYFLDCGLRNALFGGFGPLEQRADRGALAETWAMGEIAKATGLLDTVRYWRTKHGSEVDFVVDRSGLRIGVEVKAGALTQPKLSRDARTFVELYRPDRFVLLNAELHADEEHAGVPILYRPPWAFRAALSAER